MQLIDWIILGAMVVAVCIVVGIVYRKSKKLVLLDIDAMPKAQLKHKKYQIIEERLERKAKGARSAAMKVLTPVTSVVSKKGKALYEKLVTLERKYRHAESADPQTQEEKEKTRKKIVQLLEKGAELYKEENFGEAEDLFLDVIRISPKEIEAYEYLGEVYFQKKEYEHAIETFQYAMKLNPEDDRIYYDLGNAYRAKGDGEKALECFQRCATIAPKNPRNLNALLELAIELKNAVLARQTLHQLQEVNPENQKLAEWEETIRKM